MELEILLVLVAGATAATFLISALVSAALHPGRPDANVSEWLEAFRLARVETGELRSGSRLEGTRGPLRVTIARESVGDQQATVVRISGSRAQLSATRIASRPTLHPSVERFLYGATGRFHPLCTGDPECDSSVRLTGDERVIRALCDPSTRLELRSMIDTGVEIEGAHSRRRDNCALVVWTTDALDPGKLAPLIDFIERLVPPQDLGRRIADNTAHEPLASVRVRNVATLVEHFRDHPATRPTLLTALNDPSEEVRVVAAGALGDEGLRTLLKVALSPASQQAHAARAIAAAGPRFTSRHARWLLRRAIRAGRVTVAKACLERLDGLDDPQSVRAVSVALSSDNDEVALLTVRQLKIGATPRFETTLVQALQHRLVEVQRAAVTTLGRVGTSASIGPLRQWDDRHGLDRLVRADARRAIAAIQSRIPGASPGQLSIAGAEAGQVSLAEGDRRGEVSLERSRSE